VDAVATWATLTERGYVIVDAPDEVARALHADPWQLAAELLAGGVTMVERHPILAVAQGRSFASTMVHTPLHTDSQDVRGAAADVQVMACVQAASEGGETLLLDAWALLSTLEHADPRLYEALFDRVRRFRFVFGDLDGPTVAVRGGRLCFTHTPHPQDDLGARLAPFLDATPTVHLRIEAGQILLVDNHRMLHGRTAFRDPGRRFVRLLVWTRRPIDPPARILARARRIGQPVPDDEAERRLTATLELLRGRSPGVLAEQLDVDEAELYRWRNAMLRVARQALQPRRLRGWLRRDAPSHRRRSSHRR